MPVECLVLAIQLLHAELSELVSPAASVTCAWAAGNFPVKGEVSSLEEPDHSANEKATVPATRQSTNQGFVSQGIFIKH